MRHTKKLLSLLLVVAMVLPMVTGILPTASAEETEYAAEETDYAAKVMALQAFKAAELDTYKEWLTHLDSTADADAYNRLSQGIAKLNAGYTFYDDFKVFGTYASALDDTAEGFKAGDYFATTANTTNYQYLYGGAVSQKKENGTGVSDDRASNSTHPLSNFSLNTFKFSAFHFKAYDYEGAEHNKNWTSADNLGFTMLANNNVAGSINGKMNFAVIDLTKAGIDSSRKLESFSVETIGHSGALIIYNYIDNQNWNAVFTGSEYEYWSVNCVNGVFQDRDGTSGMVPTWKDSHATYNAPLSLFHTYRDASIYLGSWVDGANGMLNGSKFMDDQPITLNFVWNKTKGCYDLTFRWENGNKDLKTVSLTTDYTSGLTPAQLSNVMVTDIVTDMAAYPNDKTVYGITSIAAKWEICEHTYVLKNDDAYHWQECSNCGEIDPANPKTAHTSPCHECGYNLTAADAAKAIDEIRAFYGSKLYTYQLYADLLKDDTTYATQYARLTNGMAQLKTDYSFYDDFKVFGTYESELDDTKISAGEYFETTTNTTAYQYLFGGAVSQKRDSGVTDSRKANSTHPLSNFSLNTFKFSAFHFAAYDYEGAEYNKNWTSADSLSYTMLANNNVAGSVNGMMNFAVIDLTKVGLNRLAKVESFTLDTYGKSGALIIYNYIDNQNWNAVFAGGDREYWSVNCVEGVFLSRSGSNRAWYNSEKQLNGVDGNTLFHAYAQWSSYLEEWENTAGGMLDSNANFTDGEPITLTFVWNAATNCYDLTFTWNNDGTVKTLKTVALDSNVNGGLPISQLSNVMVTDIITDMSKYPNDTLTYGIKSITAEFVQPECDHSFTVADTETAEVRTPATCTALATYYKQCKHCDVSAKGIDESAYFTGGTPEPHTYVMQYDDTNHWKACSVCGTIDPDHTATAHTSDPCHICGRNMTAEVAATSVANIHAFYADKLDTYQVYAAALKDNTTYATQYARVTNGVAKLNAGYTFYDDGENLGDYKTTEVEELYTPVFHYAPLDTSVDNSESAYQVLLTYDMLGYGPYALGKNYNSENSSNSGNSHLAWNHRHWIALADKAGYEAAMQTGETNIQQVIPDGNIITDFQIDYNPYYNVKIIYNYVDASNYSYIYLMGNNVLRIRAVHIVDGAEVTSDQGNNANQIWQYSTTLEGVLPTDENGPLNGGYSKEDATDNAKLLQTPDKTLRLVWNKDDGCYHVIFSGITTPAGVATQVEIALTNELTGGTLKLAPLTNIYFKHDAIEGMNLYTNTDGTATNIGPETTNKDITFPYVLPSNIEIFKNVMVAYQPSDEALCVHDFSVENVAEAIKKLEATCTTLAVYYKNCSKCGASALEYDETATFEAGELEKHDYTTKRSDTHHWKECHNCGYVDEATMAEHDNQPCTVCGYTRSPEGIAKAVLELKGFYASKADVYWNYLGSLAMNKAKEEPIDDTTNRTWKEAYDRVANALAKLDEGEYDFYDDFQVFGEYASELKETGVGVGDPFITTVNTTNYLYMYGGAESQKLTDSASNEYAGGAEANTNPLKNFNLTSFTFPAFHFAEWQYDGAVAKQNWTDDSGFTATVLVNANNEKGVKGQLNYTVLNPEVVGFQYGQRLDKFSVDTLGSSGVLVIYNYIDNQNWNAVFAGDKREYWSLNCVNGVLQNRDTATVNEDGTTVGTTRLWYESHSRSGYGDSLFHTVGDASLYLGAWVNGANGMLADDGAEFRDDQPITLNFVWNTTTNCYDLTFTWNNNGTIKTLKTVALDENVTDGLKTSPVSNVMISDLKNNMTQGTWATSTYGTRGIATTFVDAGHVHNFNVEKATLRYLKAEATYAHGTQYYYSCTCGESALADEGQYFELEDALDKSDVMPVILGSKLLKQSPVWGEQVLRIDVDYAQVEAFKELDGLTEYGMIIADLNTLTYDQDGNPDKASLIAKYSTNAVKAGTTQLPAPEEDGSGQRLVYYKVHIKEAYYGGRFVLIAYVKDGNGEFHYSMNTLGGSDGETPIEGLKDGVISTGIMRVMKAILKDNSEIGFNSYITTAVTQLVDEGVLSTTTTYDTTEKLITLIQGYVDGTITVKDGAEDYATAKAATAYVYQKCAKLYDEAKEDQTQGETQ